MMSASSLMRHHAVLAQIQRLRVLGVHQAPQAFEAIADVAEAARLLAVAPDLDLRIAGQLARATLRHSAAGAFSRPPVHVPSGPKMLWKRTMRVCRP